MKKLSPIVKSLALALTLKIFRYSFGTLMLFSLLLSSSSNTHAVDKVSIGVPSFDKEMNILKSPSIAARVARSGMIRSLTRKKTGGYLPYSLDLADNMTVAGDFSKVNLRIARGRNFNNGQPINPIDIAFSLRRCIQLGILTGVKNVSLKTKTEKLKEGDWVEIWLETPSPETTTQIPIQLTECPIIDAESSYLFSEKLGQNTLLVGAGDFRLSLMKEGKSFELKRVVAQAVRKGPSLVEVRGFGEASRALTALRLGTVDVIFVEDELVLKRAGEDETLLLSTCFGRRIIKRKGLQFNCEDTLNFESIEYVG